MTECVRAWGSDPWPAKSKSRRLPPWIRVAWQGGERYGVVRRVLSEHRLHTVCEGAQCPNVGECWGRGTATFLILGERCTRRCRFCAVGKGPPAAPDPEEPRRVSRAARELGLRHVVVTSVTRDDLADGGAEHFAETVRAIRDENPGATVEVLTPDFGGRAASVRAVLAARPDVFAHNLETVQRLQRRFRPEASYERSLGVLRQAAREGEGIAVKSSLLLGMGETDAEVEAALRDLYEAGCRIVTLGQYLAPSRSHVPVARFIPPDGFAEWARRARALGFEIVHAGPLVRSSYRAEELVFRARG